MFKYVKHKQAVYELSGVLWELERALGVKWEQCIACGRIGLSIIHQTPAGSTPPLLRYKRRTGIRYSAESRETDQTQTKKQNVLCNLVWKGLNQMIHNDFWSFHKNIFIGFYCCYANL